MHNLAGAKGRTRQQTGRRWREFAVNADGAVLDDDEALGALVGACDFVDGKDDRASVGVQFVEQLDQARGRCFVEAREGFIEQQDVGAMEQGASQSEALAVSARQDAGRTVKDTVQVEYVGQFIDARLGVGDAKEPGVEEQVVAPGEIGVQQALVRDPAEHATQPRASLAEIDTGERHGSGSGNGKPCTKTKQRGLAGAVGTHECNKRTTGNREVDAAQYDVATKRFANAAEL